jgi:hypothetical protein
MQQTDDTIEPMYFTMVANKSPTIMCERHAQAFEIMMMQHEIPHTIYEMDESEEHECQACNLKDTVDEMTRPKIILPGDYH